MRISSTPIESSKCPVRLHHPIVSSGVQIPYAKRIGTLDSCLALNQRDTVQKSTGPVTWYSDCQYLLVGRIFIEPGISPFQRAANPASAPLAPSFINPF